MKKIAIIGAGASGLICAKALENYFDITIYEMNKKIGSKVLASGNGRCNLSNTNTKPYFFNINKSFKDYLKECNLETITDNEGRMYPISNSSLSVLNFITPNNSKILLNTPVIKIKKINNLYKINDDNIMYNYLILASGSIAGIDSQKIDLVYNYLKYLNLDINVKPSLTGFVLQDYNTKFKNIRAKASVSLYKDNELVHKEDGEVMFKEDGISGIVIFNMSYYYNLNYSKNSTFKIKLNLYPNINNRSFNNLKYNIDPKLYEILKLKEKSIDLTYDIIKTYNFNSSQSVYGGIDLNLINSDLSLKKDRNIFILGELINVCFPCGGFNLDFAFNTGLKAGEEIKKREGIL